MTTVEENYAKTEQKGSPEIYVFTTGEVVAHYTSWHENVKIENVTYLAVPIKRSGYQHDTQMGKTRVDISASILPELARYIANSPIEPTRVKILRGVSDDLTTWVAVFEGNIQGVTFKDGTASARCEAFSSLLDVILPKAVVKPTCNHVIFDSGCGLNAGDFTVTNFVINVSGSSLAVSGLADSGFNFATGFLKYGTDFRMITKQVGDVIDLHAPFYSLTPGTFVSVVAGCDGTSAMCNDVYDNRLSFLGMESVPTKNPCLYGA